MTKTTAEEVREVEAERHASHLVAGLASITDALGSFVERDPVLAAEGLAPIDQAAAIALVQDLRKRLGAVEMDLTATLGKAEGKHQGNLPDGRQFTLNRTQDRKGWNHEDWKRDARRMVVLDHAPHADDVAVDAATGEARPLREVLHAAIAVAQEVHGSTAPRSTALKRLGLYASDYAETSPGGWKFDTIAPSATTTDKD